MFKLSWLYFIKLFMMNRLIPRLSKFIHRMTLPICHRAFPFGLQGMAAFSSDQISKDREHAIVASEVIRIIAEEYDLFYLRLHNINENSIIMKSSELLYFWNGVASLWSRFCYPVFWDRFFYLKIFVQTRKLCGKVNKENLKNLKRRSLILKLQ